MYNGVKRKTQKTKPTKAKRKFQMLSNEEIETNGIITKQLVFKTKEFKRDKTITWKDFEIGNLIATGIDPKSLPTTILEADIDKLHADASKAESTLDKYQIIKEIEMEENNNESTTEQKK